MSFTRQSNSTIGAEGLSERVPKTQTGDASIYEVGSLEKPKTVPGLGSLVLGMEMQMPRDPTPHTVGYVLATLGLARFDQWSATRRQFEHGATKVVEASWLQQGTPHVSPGFPVEYCISRCGGCGFAQAFPGHFHSQDACPICSALRVERFAPSRDYCVSRNGTLVIGQD